MKTAKTSLNYSNLLAAWQNVRPKTWKGSEGVAHEVGVYDFESFNTGARLRAVVLVLNHLHAAKEPNGPQLGTWPGGSLKPRS